MPQPAPKKIFLSYRRDDSSGYTSLLYDWLTDHYGPTTVFCDVHSIEPMTRFREEIRQSLSQCAVTLVVMSKQWSGIVGTDGVARLQVPDDVVRWEIETTLTLNIPILPVLVGGARMPRATDLPPSIRRLADYTGLEVSDGRLKEDFQRLVKTVDKNGPILTSTLEDNPFSVRNAIRNDSFFYNRERELKMLRDYLKVRQSCQLVGPWRIGKSSLLLYIQRHCAEWLPNTKLAYLDLEDPRCYTLAGWLEVIANGFSLEKSPRSLSELMVAVEGLLERGVHPILFLDEFGQMARRKSEFPADVYHTLRACGQRGMSIFTAARKRLSELTDPEDDSSPFFNTFSPLYIEEFSRDVALKFVQRKRDGIRAFTNEEANAILGFSAGHPWKLQTACFHVLSAGDARDSLDKALERAERDWGRRQ
jgi:hypothetical protein